MDQSVLMGMPSCRSGGIEERFGTTKKEKKKVDFSGKWTEITERREREIARENKRKGA